MFTLTLLRLIRGEGSNWSKSGKRALKIIDNFPPGAFYSSHSLRQLGTKEQQIFTIKRLGFRWIYLKINIWDKNLFHIMLSEVLKSCKTIDKRTGSFILQLLTEVPSQNLKYRMKHTWIFHLILVVIQLDIVCWE